MFGIEFSELVVIGIVALVVLGPERLPKVARMAGHLFGRAQRYVSQVKVEIEKEIKLDELKKIQEDMKQAASKAEHALYDAKSSVESESKSLTSTWQEATAEPPAAPPAVTPPAPPPQDKA
jgi:sec-independent protein translocase protein TatB